MGNGELVLMLNGQDRKLKFNVRTLNMWCQLQAETTGKAVELDQLDRVMNDLPKSPSRTMTFYGELVYCAMVTECHYQGKSVDFDLNQVHAWLGDLGIAGFEQIGKAFGASFKSLVPKNPKAPVKKTAG